VFAFNGDELFVPEYQGDFGGVFLFEDFLFLLSTLELRGEYDSLLDV